MAYRYNIRNCSTQVTTYGYANSGGIVTIGRVYKDSSVCWEVLSLESQNGPAAGIFLEGLSNYTNCTDCNNSTGTTNTPPTTYYLYNIRPCGNSSSAATTIAYRDTTDLFPGNSIKVNGLCWEVLSAAGSTTTLPPGALNIISGQKFLDCLACSNSITIPPSGPSGARIQYVLQNCTAGGTQVLQGYRTADSTETFGSSLSTTTGGVYKIGGLCYQIISAVWAQGAIGVGTDVSSLSSGQYIGCAPCVATLPNVTNQTTGPAGQAITYSTGYMCTQQGCVVQLYNAEAGEEPQFFTLQDCQIQCQAVGPNGVTGTNLVVGYICTNNGCTQIYYDPNTGQEAYNTLVECQNACTGGPQPPGPNGPTGPVLTVFPELITGDGDESNPPGSGGPTPIDPCDDAYEPTEGQLLRMVTPIVVGGRESSQPGAVLDPDFYEYLIPECWRWKYKVCAKRPAGSQLGTPWRMEVCLRNLAEPPEWPYPMPGTFIRFECKAKDEPNIGPNAPKYEKWAVYHDGYGGTYSMFIESNSVYCGYTPTSGCPSSGILKGTYCVGVDQYGEYHDGKCGTYTQKISTNSKICGYKDPPPPPPPPTEDNTIKEIKTVENVAIYVPISTENKLNGIDINSYPLWSDNDSYLRNYYTSSLSDSSSLDYILDVYDKPLTASTCSAELQYKIIYADYEGKGATDLGGLDSETLTKAMYTQYAHTLLSHGQTKFNFNGIDEDYVYIIDVSRNRFKQSMDPGNWQLTIASCSFTLNTGSNSSLSEMFSTSYGNSSITLIDNATKQITERGPIYITSKNYDVQIGTIEDGLYTTYITSSVASSSLIRTDVTHVSLGTSQASNTAVVTGAEALPFVFTNTTGSFTLTRNYQDGYDPTTNEYEIGYSGNWTGSFTGSMGGIQFIPNRISGSLQATWYTTYSDNPLGNGKLRVGTFFAKPVSYTTGSRTYNGFLKWGFNKNEGGAFECLSCQEYFITASQGQLNVSGTITGSAFGYLMADSWGDTTIISTSSYTELVNGNILYPVRSDVFGKFYPNHGIIVLSGKKLDELGFNTNRSVDKHGYNTYRLFHGMELILKQQLKDSSGDPLGFYGRSVDINHTTRCFITLKTGNLNFSNNPTYVTGSEGEIIEPFVNQQKSYFTSIGLYNADKELLAIGKVSKPIMSSMIDESLFTVKVTY